MPAALQITLQGISFVTAFLLIRTLSIADYAIYSGLLVLSQALMSACDLGAVSSIGYFYKKVERQAALFLRYFRAVVQVRSFLFVIVAVILYPAFFFGSSLGSQVTALPLLIAISIATSVFQASYGTTATALRFVSPNGVVTSLVIEVFSSVARLALIGLIITLLAFDSARTALLITAIVAAAQAIASWRALNRHLPPHKEMGKDPAPLPRREVLSYVLPIIPGGLYHSLQPLLLTWLAAYNGGLRQIAEVSVLGRIGLVFGVLSFVVSYQIIPALGRADSQAQFLRVYFKSAIGMIVLLLAALAGGFLFPSQIMSLAGAKYSALDAFLPVALAAAVLQIIGGFAVSVLRLEGWNRFEPACTILQILGQVAWILLVPINSTHDIIVFSFVSTSLYCLPYILLNVLGLLAPQAFERRPSA
jgi:O-antigen/teichoic acid export membrane protein